MTVTIRRLSAKGKIVITDEDGKETETTEVVDEVTTDKPMANVGVSLGATINTGDYNSRRVEISLYMPSETDKKSVNKTFKRCLKWCDDKLDEIIN